MRPELRKGEEEVPDIALRVDRQRRNSIQRGFFEQGEAEAGLAAARHPENHGMRSQVARIVHEGRRRGLRSQPAEVKRSESFNRAGRYGCRASLSLIRHD